MFKLSGQVYSEWLTNSENRHSKGWEAELPEGGLPYLPVGGIEGMNWEMLDRYWCVVMNIVLKDRQGRLQYDSHK